MDSEEELRKRLEDLEKSLAHEKWRNDYEAQKVRDQANIAEITSKNQKENRYFYWAIAIFIVFPFIYYLLK
jgi:hypothetical protein